MMLEVYDRDKTAALLKEARTITAGLKIEVGEIVAQMSHVLEGGEEGADGIKRARARRSGPAKAGARNSNRIRAGARCEVVLAVLALTALDDVLG